MKEVLLYKYDPFYNGKTGKKIKKPIVNQEIKLFEKILVHALKDLSLQVHELSRFDFERTSPTNNVLSIMFHGDRKDFPNMDLFYMQMHIKTQFQLDTNGWGVSNSNLQNLRDISRNITSGDDAGFEQIKLELEKAGTKLSQSKRLLRNLPSTEYILVALQTPGDTVIQKYSNMSVNDLISKISDISANLDIKFILKPHPNTVRNRKIMPHLIWTTIFKKNVNIFMGDISEAIKNSSGVIVLNSGVGFEALTHNKPVYTFAEADYSVVAHTINEIPIEQWCLTLPRKNSNSFFNDYCKYNIFLSDQNKAYNQVINTIKEVLRTKKEEIEFDNKS